MHFAGSRFAVLPVAPMIGTDTERVKYGQAKKCTQPVSVPSLGWVIHSPGFHRIKA